MFEHWKDHFHPHEGNDHKPPAYHMAGAIALSLVVVSILSFATLHKHYITHSENFLSAVLPAVLTDLANEDRAKAGLSGLTPNETLKQAAQMKADHMAELGYFSHDAPDGTTPWEWFQRAGYEYETAGENLAVNFSDSVDVEEAWMDSPTHRENILEEDFTEIGIATARGEYEGEETVFVVQMFGRPSASELAQRNGDSTVEGDNTEEETTEVALAEEDTSEEPTVDTSGSDQETETQEEESSEPEPIAQAPAEEPEPEPEPQPTESEPPAEEEAETTTTTSPQDAPATTSAPTFATPTPIAQVQGESGISLEPFLSSGQLQASRMAHLLSRPEFLFKTLMLTLFALIALSLLVSVGVEAKRHHVAQATKALGALVILLLVFYFGMNYLFEDPAVAAEKISEVSPEMTVELH